MTDPSSRISPVRARARGDDDRLDSWKEIAAYLRRSVRTARRWERHEELPVRRHLHQERGSVYAYKSEIDTWRRGREAQRSGEDGARATADAAGGRRIHLVADSSPAWSPRRSAERSPRPPYGAPEILAGEAGGVFLEAILASSTDIVCAFDRKMRYILCSDSGARAVGGDREKMIGRTWRELGLPAEVMAPVHRHVENVFESGRSIRAEASYPTLSGPSHYEYILDPIYSAADGEITAVLAIVRALDRSESKRK